MDTSPPDLAGFIQQLGRLNPSGNPHGLVDSHFTALCRAYDPSRTPATPLTLEEWRALRAADDVEPAFARDILDAEDPATFLVVLRDRLVFTAGCADGVIILISTVLDPYVERGTLRRKEAPSVRP